MIRYININGELTPEGKPAVSATSRAVSYGDGCFETFVSYGGEFLHFEDHFDRLWAGLEYLGMKSELTQDSLRLEVQNMLRKNELEKEKTVVRIQCYREGDSGYFDISDRSGFIISNRAVSHQKEGLKLKSVSVRAIPTIALERKVKLSNSINYIKAAQEARKNNGDDALMLTIDDKVSETTIANIFWIKGNQVFTPSVRCDLLPGITRAIVIKLVKENPDVTIEEGEYSLEDVLNADSVFCCNSVMEIRTVASVNDHSFEENDILVESLKKEFQVYKMVQLK